MGGNREKTIVGDGDPIDELGTTFGVEGMGRERGSRIGIDRGIQLWELEQSKSETRPRLNRVAYSSLLDDSRVFRRARQQVASSGSGVRFGYIDIPMPLSAPRRAL